MERRCSTWMEDAPMVLRLGLLIAGVAGLCFGGALFYMWSEQKEQYYDNRSQAESNREFVGSVLLCVPSDATEIRVASSGVTRASWLAYRAGKGARLGPKARELSFDESAALNAQGPLFTGWWDPRLSQRKSGASELSQSGYALFGCEQYFGAVSPDGRRVFLWAD
jgi:hypothetical protein